MPAKEQTPIIIKRVKKVAGGHHGGAWKIAYADFVTAMMAFFLLMWLLGSTTKGELQGIAEYFRTPLKVALSGGSGSGDSSSVIKGGGTDLTRSYGQVQKTDAPEDKKTINLQAAKAQFRQLEAQRLEELKKTVEQAMERSPRLAPYRNQIRLDISPEGLRIQIVDDLNRPMFDTGSALVKDYMRGILRELGKLLNEVDNNISLAGHTDTAPYAMGERGYSNWELSADRANASRRELVAGGMEESKIVRVVGLASSVPYDRADPKAPTNRRISIVVLNRRTAERIRGEEPGEEVGNMDEAEAALHLPPGTAAGTQSAEGAAPVPAQ